MNPEVTEKVQQIKSQSNQIEQQIKELQTQLHNNTKQIDVLTHKFKIGDYVIFKSNHWKSIVEIIGYDGSSYTIIPKYKNDNNDGERYVQETNLFSILDDQYPILLAEITKIDSVETQLNQLKAEFNTKWVK